MATIANGASAATSATNRSNWVTMSRMGVRSTIRCVSLVVDSAFDEAELRDRQENDEQHEDDALSGGTGVVESFEAVEVDLVDHQVRGPGRPALGHDVDDAEAVGEAVREVDDNHEKEGRSDQRE